MEKMEKKYLTEEKMIEFLYKHVDAEGVHNRQFDWYKFRPDFVSHKHKLIVEYDGNSHYMKAKTILDDQKKTEIIIAAGFKIIRIPYFVQLDKQVMKNLFSNYMIEEPYDYVDYPHGFIDKNVFLPADFCSLGIRRFYCDLKRFDFIFDNILQSLANVKKRTEEVYPLNFHFI